MSHDIEDVVDDLQQVTPAEMDVRDIAPIRVAADRTQHFRFHQIRKSDDRIQRGAQLVAHVGEKVGFGFAGSLGPDLGRLQFLDPSPQLVVPGGQCGGTLGHLTLERGAGAFGKPPVTPTGPAIDDASQSAHGLPHAGISYCARLYFPLHIVKFI